jgi:hypothetical protein
VELVRQCDHPSASVEEVAPLVNYCACGERVGRLTDARGNTRWAPLVAPASSRRGAKYEAWRQRWN